MVQGSLCLSQWVFWTFKCLFFTHCVLSVALYPPTALTWKSLGKPNKPFPQLPLLIKVLCILQTVVSVLWGSSLGAGLWEEGLQQLFGAEMCRPSCRAWTFFRRSLRSSYVSLALEGQPHASDSHPPPVPTVFSALSILLLIHLLFFLSRGSPLPARIGINKLQLLAQIWYHLKPTQS